MGLVLTAGVLKVKKWMEGIEVGRDGDGGNGGWVAPELARLVQILVRELRGFCKGDRHGMDELLRFCIQ